MIQNNGTRVQYTATAAQTIFPYTFEIFASGDLTVEQNGSVITAYTVSGVGNDSGGNVTLDTGATTGDVITIYRDMDLERLTDYQNNGDFLASEVNDDYDRIWAALQQLQTNTQAAIRPSPSDTALDSTNTELASIATRGGKALGFASDGTLSYLSSAVPNGDFTHVSTVAAMTALTGLAAGVDIIQTAEFSTGNGGGGVYDVVLTTSVTPNGYNIIQGVADTSISFVLRVEEVNVKQFGATGDGTTDDSGAVQAAIDYVEDLDYKTFREAGAIIFFPKGRYVCTQLRVSLWGVNFRGEGVDASMIVNAHASNEMLRVERSGGTIGFMSWADLQFRNTVTRDDGDNPLVVFVDMVNSNFSNVHWVSSPIQSDGERTPTRCDMMRMDAPFEIGFYSCVWRDCIGFGLDLLSGAQSDGMLFENCIFFNNTVGCLGFAGTGSGTNNLTFSGGKFLAIQGGSYAASSAYAKTTIATTATSSTIEVSDGNNFTVNRAVLIGDDADVTYAMVTGVSGVNITLDRSVSVTAGENIFQGTFGCVQGLSKSWRVESTQLEGLDYGILSLPGAINGAVVSNSVSNVSKPYFMSGDFRTLRIRGSLGAATGTLNGGDTYKYLTTDDQTNSNNKVMLAQITIDGSSYYDGTFSSFLNNLTAFKVYIDLFDYLLGRIVQYEGLDGQVYLNSSYLTFDRETTGDFCRMRWQENGTDKWFMNFSGANGDLSLTRLSDSQNSITLYGSNGFPQIGDGAWDGKPMRLGAYHFWVDSSDRLRIKNGVPTSDTDGTVVGTQT